MTTASSQNPFKIRIVSAADRTERVTFDVSPTLSVNAPVEYTNLQPIHMPGAMMVYKNTGPRVFSLTITLISRTPQEATLNQDRWHRLQAWRYPYFGRGSLDGSVIDSSSMMTGGIQVGSVSDSPATFTDVSGTRIINGGDPGQISSNDTLSQFEFGQLGEAWSTIKPTISTVKSFVGDMVSTASGIMANVGSALGKVNNIVSGSIGAYQGVSNAIKDITLSPKSIKNVITSVDTATKTLTNSVSQVATLGNSVKDTISGIYNGGGITGALSDLSSGDVGRSIAALVSGDSSEGGSSGSMLGAPPPILFFSAYSNENSPKPTSKNYKDIPTVITNLDGTFPNNIDYIQTLFNEPFPIRMDVTLSLTETHSPREYENFSLSQYKNGELPFF